MHGLDRKWRLVLRAGVVLTLWAGLLVAPRVAQAECAHYVVSKNDPVHLFATLEQKVFEDASGQAAQEPRDSSNRPSPCPGGMCSQGPTLPLAPAPDPVRIDQWDLLTAQRLLDGPGAAFCLPREESARPTGFRLAIFHPPRLRFSPIAF
jgi:hypothetical protein